jgi:cell wall-associated NlpC family hydrolase
MPEALHARPTRLTATVLVILTCVALCLGFAAPAGAAAQRTRKIHDAVAVAQAQKGDPYRYGATGPDRFDCSGLVQFSFGRAGIRVPRTSDSLARYARRIKRARMRPGDLMFFHSRGNVYHVGIFTGRSRSGRPVMVHAPSTGRRVRADAPWTRRWFAGTLRRR